MRVSVGLAVWLGVSLWGTPGLAHSDAGTEETLWRLVLPDAVPAPTALHVLPDTVLFGGQAVMAVDFPAGTPLPPVADLSLTPPGISLQADDRILAPAAVFPATSGTRLLVSVRPYVLGSFRLTVGDLVTDPVVIRGQVQDPGETAPVRGPRVWGVPLYLPVGLALLLLLAAGLVWWLWRRRRRPEPLTQWDLEPPAWLAAAVGLEALLRNGVLDRGHTRDFLDELAGIIRRFVGVRYRVPALGATGVDVVGSCRSLGHAPESPRVFARLMDTVDNLRYEPLSPSEGQCRDMAGDFLVAMDEVRVVPRFTPVPVPEMLSAEQAWSRLQGIPWLGAAPADSQREEA